MDSQTLELQAELAWRMGAWDEISGSGLPAPESQQGFRPEGSLGGGWPPLSPPAGHSSAPPTAARAPTSWEARLGPAGGQPVTGAHGMGVTSTQAPGRKSRSTSPLPLLLSGGSWGGAAPTAQGSMLAGAVSLGSDWDSGIVLSQQGGGGEGLLFNVALAHSLAALQRGDATQFHGLMQGATVGE